ncbi:MAG: cyclopropane fatty acyl phospholipid synthase [Candidatus Omnitrophica bacterium]|nr:cyclopropane fatty acyl phospholipid synthase [Candidatus Omnitrophota bacterium]MCB9720094.1 cyclopropane fatty acyl phospholipid synthase [Candidatus Omnitrophota bacterium]
MASVYQQECEKLFQQADIRFNDTRPGDITVHDPRFYKLFLQNSRLGLGESYMDGWWDCADLELMFFKLFTSNIDISFDMKNLPFYLAALKAKIIPMGSKERSACIGPNHYDNGNTLYRLMLGPTMQYSCGYWKDAGNLDEAQTHKMELICRKLQLRPGMRVLDVGCGWGSLAKYMAEHYQVSVVGITVSQEQLEWGRQNCAGLAVDLRLLDYRDVSEQFDRVVSVGMMEHVGVKYHRVYMESVKRCLKKDGLFLLHHITTNQSKWSNLWLDKYIFPGAKPPSMREIARSSEGVFIIEDVHNFGADYHPTLMAWYENFCRHWPEIADKYNRTFYRMWEYYLLSVAAGFRARGIQLTQTVFSVDGILGGYPSVR